MDSERALSEGSRCPHPTLNLVEYESDSVYKCQQCGNNYRITIEPESVLNDSSSSSSIDFESTSAHILEEVDSENKETLSSVEEASLSRLQAEYKFLAELGKGGFGSVGKYRNKLDGQVYAIKKVALIGNSSKEQKEIELLSTLNHKNIVRYFYCWVEKDIINSDNSRYVVLV